MESDSVIAIPIVHIEEAEVYQVNGSKQKKIETGALQILHVSAMNCFLIQVGKFRYSLSKEIPILGSNKQPHCIRAYVLPNIEGYYVIRITELSDERVLTSLEQIFLNHSDFGEEQADEQRQEQSSKIRGSQPSEKKELAKESPSEEPKEKETKTKTEIASNIIYKGGELIGAGLKKGGELVAKGITATGDYIQNKFIKKTEEKDVNESTIQKLKVANTATNVAVTITKVQIQGIITIGKAIGSEMARKFEKSESGQKFQNYKHYETVKEIGKSTLHAAASIYSGMVDALFSIGKGIGTTTTKLVTAKYGEKSGEATKEGLEAVGNVGQVIKMTNIEATKAIKEGTEKKDPSKSN